MIYDYGRCETADRTFWSNLGFGYSEAYCDVLLGYGLGCAGKKMCLLIISPSLKWGKNLAGSYFYYYDGYKIYRFAHAWLSSTNHHNKLKYKLLFVIMETISVNSANKAYQNFIVRRQQLIFIWICHSQ